MHHSFNSISRERSQFMREFRRQIRMMIVVTLGFTVAFTWRQTVFDISQSIVEFFTHIQSSTKLSIITSWLMTKNWQTGFVND